MTTEQRSDEPLNFRRIRVLLGQRWRQGRRRAKSATVPILIAALAAGAAWAVAHYLLDHEQPFFAPIAAWVCLGFSPDRQVRKVAELAVGVSLGVGFGELIAHLVGTGVWQIMLVIVIASLLARLVDRGAMLTVQAGVQGIVIVALPAITIVDGAAGRWIDALIGGAFALVVAALTPGDARRRARELAHGATTDLAQLMRHLAAGLAASDVQQVHDTLVEGRGTQGVLDDWSEVVRNARLTARISPTSRSYLPELAELQHANLMVDRAVRNARVLTRRAVTAVEHDSGAAQIAGWIDQIADAVDILGNALGSGENTLGAREALTHTARKLEPGQFDEVGWRMQTLVIIMRSLVVDLLQATGLSMKAATALLANGEPPEA